jgi:hypothetical protein
MKKRFTGGARSTRPAPPRVGAERQEVVREQAVDAVGDGDQGHAVEAAPGGVALQGGGVAGVEAEAEAVDGDLGHGGHVAQGEVPALAGDRVDAARGVADEHGAGAV